MSTRAVINLLCDQFPEAFSRPNPRPLKLGVHAEALAALGEAVTLADLRSALRAYTSRRRYLQSLLAGASRIDLQGNPAGVVTDDDQRDAQLRLAELVQHASPAVVQRKKPPVIPPAPTTPSIEPETETANTPVRSTSASKRLSLADLREAGRRRRKAKG
jgi:ProP effector